MEIRLQLFLSIFATGVLLAISGFLVSEQITKVRESFDEVQNQATPAIIALGNLKADFNHLVSTILAFSIHASDEHREDIELAREQLLLSYEEYAALESDPAAAELIAHEIDVLLLRGDEMMMAAEAATHSHDETEENSHSSHEVTSHEHGSTAEHIIESNHSHAHSVDQVPSSSDSTLENDLDDIQGTGEFTEGILMLHEALLEFDLQAAAVNTEIDVRIEENFANMQIKQNSVLEEIETGTNLNILLTAAILGVTGGVGGVVAFSISRRVIHLKKTAGEIASGNLDRQIMTAGADEIAALATSFEHMRKSLVKAQEDLKERNMELHELNTALERANLELKKLDKLKDEFIGVASHELRSPIHPILGYASMAKDGMIDDKEALDIIYKQAKRLRQLANDILDVSRIESGTLPYSMKDVDVHEILANCIEAITPSVSSSVAIDTDFEKQEVVMAGDSERLTQVFTNLLGNALKFTKKGRIAVKTRLLGSDSIVITVSDTGGGIPKEILPRLFSKFATRKVGDNEAHGTGLGLFISKSIVEAHGGRISAYNNESEGATFKIELPLNAKDKNAEKPMAIRTEKSR